MKKLILSTIMMALVIPLLLGVITSWAADSVRLLHVIPIPGFADPAHPAVFDIGWADSGKFFFANRTPGPGGRIEVIDAVNDTLLGSIPGFVGNVGSKQSGPNGVLALQRADGRTELWAGDGDSTVKVVDLDKMAIVDSIKTGGTMRADELAYDPQHRVIMVGNDRDNPPFITFISQETHKVLGKIVYDGVNAPKVMGIEQPVYDTITNKFYQSIPASADNPGGEINVIDPVSMKITNRYPVTDCKPNGLTLGPDQHLLLGCSNVFPRVKTPRSIIMDAKTGKVLATITQVAGSDEVWFNKGDNRYYLAAHNWSPPVLGVIDALTNEWIENVPASIDAKAVAVNPTNNHIFVPMSLPSDNSKCGCNISLGVAVYGH